MAFFESLKEKIGAAKGKLLIAASLGSVTLVQYASAATSINDSIGPVIEGVVELFPTMLSLVLSALPIIIAMAVIGFVLGIFDGILGKIKM